MKLTEVKAQIAKDLGKHASSELAEAMFDELDKADHIHYCDDMGWSLLPIKLEEWVRCSVNAHHALAKAGKHPFQKL